MSDSYSSTNDSVPLQFPSSNLSLYDCSCPGSLYMDFAFSFTCILLSLPLSVFVLYLGLQRWKRQRATAATVSHSDFFTYNIAVIELIGVLACVIRICSTFSRLPQIMEVGMFIGAFLWSGQMLFPILTCVDCYLAVVHPITYLRLKQRDGVRIRNISSALVWLQGFGGPCLIIMIKHFPEYIFVPSVFQLILYLFIMLFCSLSVLCVLICPRPGELGGDRVRIHQSKQKALRTITIIMGVLLLRFGGNLVFNVLLSSDTVSNSGKCVVTAARGWLDLPSGLTLPLLFVHRAGKLPGCKRNTESG